jgi:hypothetical protein
MSRVAPDSERPHLSRGIATPSLGHPSCYLSDMAAMHPEQSVQSGLSQKRSYNLFYRQYRFPLFIEHVPPRIDARHALIVVIQERLHVIHG